MSERVNTNEIIEKKKEIEDPLLKSLSEITKTYIGGVMLAMIADGNYMPEINGSGETEDFIVEVNVKVRLKDNE